MVDTVGDSRPSSGIDADSRAALQAKRDAVHGTSLREKVKKWFRIGAAATVLTTAGVSVAKDQSPVQTVQDAASTTQSIATGVKNETAEGYDKAMRDLMGQPLEGPANKTR